MTSPVPPCTLELLLKSERENWAGSVFGTDAFAGNEASDIHDTASLIIIICDFDISIDLYSNTCRRMAPLCLLVSASR
jgi:hypothetical protein